MSSCLKTVASPSDHLGYRAGHGQSALICMNVYFRKAAEADARSLSRICLLTADAGTTAEHLHEYVELPGLVYAVPYIKLPTTFGFVLVLQGSDEVVGYVVGSTDTRVYECEAGETWWPPLQHRYPLNGARGKEADRLYLSLIHNMPTASPANISFSPAHIHINILPPYQGKGYGRQLIDMAVEYLKDQGLKGLWVGLDTRNESARRFYLKLGFRDIGASPPGNMCLDFVDWKG